MENVGIIATTKTTTKAHMEAFFGVAKRTSRKSHLGAHWVWEKRNELPLYQSK